MNWIHTNKIKTKQSIVKTSATGRYFLRGISLLLLWGCGTGVIEFNNTFSLKNKEAIDTEGLVQYLDDSGFGCREILGGGVEFLREIEVDCGDHIFFTEELLFRGYIGSGEEEFDKIMEKVNEQYI